MKVLFALIHGLIGDCHLLLPGLQEERLLPRSYARTRIGCGRETWDEMTAASQTTEGRLGFRSWTKALSLTSGPMYCSFPSHGCFCVVHALSGDSFSTPDSPWTVGCGPIKTHATIATIEMH